MFDENNVKIYMVIYICIAFTVNKKTAVPIVI